MTINDKVRVVLKDEFTFTGKVMAVRGVEVIVCFDKPNPEAEARRAQDFDPEGCLAIHTSLVKEVLP